MSINGIKKPLSIINNVKNTRSLSTEILHILGKKSSSALIVVGACLLGSGYSVAAEEAYQDPAAEVAELKQKLVEAEKKLKNKPVSENSPADAATTIPIESNNVAAAIETKAPEVEAKNLSEVVVTSRRREEKLQDVPIPISVIGGKNMERDRTVDIQDLTRRAPGLTATTPNARRTGVSLRGIGKSSGNDSMEAAVGVMIDDVFMSHVGMTYQDFTDLDRVEVLRGPQGTLMGKNTTIGVLNYVSKAPSFTQQGTIEGEVGGNQQTGILPGAFKIKSSYSNAIVDNLLAFRGSMFINKQDGDIHNINPVGGTINERNRYGGKLQFLFTPTDNIKFRVTTDYAEGRESSNVKPAMYDPANFANGVSRTANDGLTFSSRLQRDSFGGYKPIIGAQSWNQDDLGQAQPLITKNGGISGKLDWDVGPGTLTSITAYRQLHFDAKNDSDETKFDINRGGTLVDTSQYSEELRYAWSPTKWLDNQTGAFFMHTETDSLSRTLYGQDAGAFYANNKQYAALNTAASRSLLTSSLNNVYSTTLTSPATDSYALFDQANIHLTDKATLTLGVRETFESKTAATAKSASYYDGSELKVTGDKNADAIRSGQLKNSYAYKEADSLDAFSTSWLANPSYKINDNLMVYTSAAGGQKSGSIQFNSSDGSTINVKPEKSLDFELGAKSLFLNKKVMLNVNLYHTTVTDYQATTSVVDPTTATGYRSQLGNIPEITAMGLEVDSAYYPTSYLTFNAGGAFNHATYTDWHTATCPTEITSDIAKVCDNTGKQVVGAPELTGIFGVDLHKPMGFGGLTGHAWANTVVRSAQNLEAQLSSWGKQDAYQVTDLGIGLFTGQKNKYEVNLITTNVFDTHYTTSINNFSNTGAVGYDGIGARRYVGLVLRSTF
ncbi:MAG: TonB-dependent receptor [Methylococcaceae bacterium]